MEALIINDSCFKFFINRELYSSDVVHKSLYWLLNICQASIDIKNGYYEVTISDISENNSINTMICKIKQNLVDFKTREIIRNETHNIRELLIAKAFSSVDDFDEADPTVNF